MSLLKYFQKAGHSSVSADATSMAGERLCTHDDNDGSQIDQGSETKQEAPANSDSSLSQAHATSERREIPVSDQHEASLVNIHTQPGGVSGVAGVSDVAAVIGGSAGISDAVKYQLLVNHFKPGPDYRFPKGALGRTFQYRWFQGLLTVSRKMGGSVFLVSCLQLVGTINLLLVFWFSVL